MSGPVLSLAVSLCVTSCSAPQQQARDAPNASASKEAALALLEPLPQPTSPEGTLVERLKASAASGQLRVGPLPVRGRVRAMTSSASVDGPLDRRTLKRVLAEARGSLERCYTAALEGQPDLEGTLLMALAIDAEGGVSATLARGGTIDDHALGACFVRSLDALAFPALGAESVGECRFVLRATR